MTDLRFSSLLLLVFAMAVPHAAMAFPADHAGDYQSTGMPFSGGVFSGDVTMADGVSLELGNAPDYWWIYNVTSTQLELHSSDCDGIGTDCTLIIYDDGTATLDIGGPIDMSEYDLQDIDQAYFTSADAGACSEARITDAAPYPMTVKAGNNYARGTQTAANLYLAGGIDEKTITVVAANATAADTITATCNGTALAALADGTAWVTCVGDTDAACATKIAAALDAQVGACATYTSNAAVIYAQPDDCSTVSISHAASDATFLVVANGTDGRILAAGNSSSTTPIYAFSSNTTTGIGWYAANTLTLYAGGNAQLNVAVTNLNFLDNYLFSSSGILPLGGSMSSTHTLGTGAVGVANALEVDGAIHPDGGIGAGDKGALTRIRAKTESVTFANDASKATVGSIIPDGAMIMGVSGRVTTLLAGCTAVDVGDGVDADLFANDLALAAGSTFSNADATASYSTIAGGNAPSLAAAEITVTAVTANCTAGVVALTVHYIDTSAATAN